MSQRTGTQSLPCGSEVCLALINDWMRNGEKNWLWRRSEYGLELFFNGWNDIRDEWIKIFIADLSSSEERERKRVYWPMCPFVLVQFFHWPVDEGERDVRISSFGVKRSSALKFVLTPVNSRDVVEFCQEESSTLSHWCNEKTEWLTSLLLTHRWSQDQDSLIREMKFFRARDSWIISSDQDSLWFNRRSESIYSKSGLSPLVSRLMKNIRSFRTDHRWDSRVVGVGCRVPSRDLRIHWKDPNGQRRSTMVVVCQESRTSRTDRHRTRSLSDYRSSHSTIHQHRTSNSTLFVFLSVIDSILGNDESEQIRNEMHRSKSSGDDRFVIFSRCSKEFRLWYQETQCFYTSSTYDLTNSLQRSLTDDESLPLWKRANERFFWNRRMIGDLIDQVEVILVSLRRTQKNRFLSRRIISLIDGSNRSSWVISINVVSKWKRESMFNWFSSLDAIDLEQEWECIAEASTNKAMSPTPWKPNKSVDHGSKRRTNLFSRFYHREQMWCPSWCFEDPFRSSGHNREFAIGLLRSSIEVRFLKACRKLRLRIA